MAQVEQWTKDLGGVTTLLTGLTGLLGALGNLLKPDWLPSSLRDWLTGLPLGWQLALAVFGLAMCGFGCYLLWRRGRRCSRVLRPEGLRLDRARQEHLVGREDDLAYLLDLCRANPLVFLEGESGTGKSALVTAGLLTALRNDPGLLPVIIENWGRQNWVGAAVSATREALLECLPEDHREPFRQLKSSDISGLDTALRDLQASIRRKPLLVFDQFDDYQTAFREQFLPLDKPVWITPAALCEQNAFWFVIAGLLDSETIHVLFVTRNDIGGGLDCVRFLAEPPRCVLPGVKRAPIEALLTNLAQAPVGGAPVIADPDAGWTRLAERIAQDLTRDRDWLLPQQLSIVLRSLSDLICLDVPSYERAGGAEGLEARFIQSELEAAENVSGIKLALLRETLFSLVDPVSQRKTILRPETEILETWVQATGHDAGAVRSALDKARERLVRVEVLRLRLDPETQAMRWQLDHDYLARGVVACVRKAAKWQILLEEAADAYDQAPLRGCWSALLGPGTLVRLLRERLRWRPEVHFGVHRRYVALSGLRLLPATMVFVIVAFVAQVGMEWNGAAELWKRLEFDYSISKQEIQTLDQVRDSSSFARSFFTAETFRTPSVAGKFLKQPHAVLHALVNLDSERGRALADQAWSAIAFEEIPTEGDERPKVAALLALAIIDPVETDVLAVQFVCAAARLVKAMDKQLTIVMTRVIELSKERIRLDLPCPGIAAGDGSSPRSRSGQSAKVGVLNTLLAAMKSSTDSDQLAALGQAYAAVADKLDEKGAREAVDALLAAMKSSTDRDQVAALGQVYAAAAVKLDEKGARAIEAVGTLLAAMKLKTLRLFYDFDNHWPIPNPNLVQVYAAAAVKLNDKDASEALGALLAAMKSSTDPRQLTDLVQVYAAPAVKLDEKGAWASEALDMLLAVMKSSSEHLFDLGQAYAAAAVKLDEKGARAAVAALLAAMKSSTDPRQLAALGQAYAAVADKLDEKGAHEAVSALLATMQLSTDRDQLAALGKAYATAAVKLDEKGARASEAVGALLVAMKWKGPRFTYQRLYQADLGQVYAAAAVKLDEKSASEAMGTLLAAMQSSSDIGQLNDLGKAYAAAAVKLDEKGAREAVAALLAAMKSSTDPNQLVALGKAYATAAVKLDEKGAWASEAVDMLLAAMKSSTDPRLGQAYAAVAVKLDEKGAREAVDALLAAMKSSTDPRQQAALGRAYAAAAVKLDEKGARAREAVDMLLAAMKSSTDSDQLAALGQAYAAAAERLPDTALSGVLDELIAAIKPSGDHGSSITHAQLHALTLSAASLLARMQPPDMADTRMREFLLIRAASGASWEPFFTALAKARKSGDDVPTMLAVAMRLQSLSAVGTAHAGQ